MAATYVMQAVILFVFVTIGNIQASLDTSLEYFIYNENTDNGNVRTLDANTGATTYYDPSYQSPFLWTGTSADSLRQRWNFVSVSSGIYNIKAKADGRCLDGNQEIRTNPDPNYFNPYFWVCYPAALNHQWSISEVSSGNGYVKARIINQINGKCLDGDITAPSFTPDYRSPFLSTCDSRKTQVWTISTTPERTLPTFTWSAAGQIPNQHCIQISESASPPSYTWNDNYLCSTNYDLTGWIWSTGGQPSGNNLFCVRWFEPVDPSWTDNWLCMPNDGFFYSFSSKGAISGAQCVQTSEPADPNTWNDNYFCVMRTQLCPSACGYGTCDTSTGTCNCNAGYSGSTCTIKDCNCKGMPAGCTCYLSSDAIAFGNYAQYTGTNTCGSDTRPGVIPSTNWYKKNACSWQCDTLTYGFFDAADCY